ncbi:hypothetical protein Tco_1567700, partial [Tanacetum coccineum]
VRNQVRPEGSIITGYLAEELIEFSNDVMKGVRNIGIPHSVVLQHMTYLTSYIEQHKQMLRVTHRGRTNKWYQSKHNEEFSYWLKDIVTENLGQLNVDKMVERLGEGPRCVVRSYQGYDINGYTFYTDIQDEKSTVQNSRVTLIASTMEFDRSNHDAMATIAKNSFYGVIQEIWELDYNTFTITLFKCKWDKSAKAKASANQNKDPARVGRSGYLGKEAQWKEEMAELVEEYPDLEALQCDPSVKHVLGRLVRNKETGKKELTEAHRLRLKQLARKEREMIRQEKSVK